MQFKLGQVNLKVVGLQFIGSFSKVRWDAKDHAIRLCDPARDQHLAGLRRESNQVSVEESVERGYERQAIAWI